MKGKAKERRKIGKVILIGMGFFLTIILTFTTTLAWFYDSDWASKYINMAGSVGIELRRDPDAAIPDGLGLATSGSGQLYFQITTEKAYPGQAVDVSASVFNDGGKSAEGGSQCYIRAHFAVYTNIGKAPNATDYNGGASSAAYIAAVNQYKIAHNMTENPTTEQLVAAGIIASDYDGGTNSKAYKNDLATAQNEYEMSATELYKFLHSLISKQNEIAGAFTNTTDRYYWKYYQHQGAMPLSPSGTETTNLEYYIDGTKVKDTSHDASNSEATSVTDVSQVLDRGYFYLCNDSAGVLKPLAVNATAVFLWNNTFIIPWQLTNFSADKLLFVAVSFQAVQTFIPKVNLDSNNKSTGHINTDPDNRLPAEECTYNAEAVQTVFSSCNFTPIDTVINVNGSDIDFADGNYDIITLPPEVNSGTA